MNIPPNSIFYRSDVEQLVASETQRLRTAMQDARDTLADISGYSLNAHDAHLILNAALEDK
jgi:hypothetical protein